MKEYWMELLIAAYTLASIDLIVTARGILQFGYTEGNPLVTTFFPNGVSWQIPAIVAASMFSFWAIYCTASYFPQEFYKYKSVYLNFIAGTMIALCLTHTFAITTWLIR
jgi:hypothetical protein